MEKPRDLAERTLRFAVATIRLIEQLPRGTTADVLGRQLLRAATSIGANYREARKARSTPDFISKMTIVEEESDEAHYWLQLLREARIVDESQTNDLIQEAYELTAIFTAAGKTAKEKLGKRR
jgi:four helix bundle protein